MNSLNIIHIDDHQLFRDSFRNVLQQFYPYVSLFQFTNSDSAIEHILSNIIQRKQIDLIVTDFKHYGKNGIEFAQQLAGLGNECGVDIPVMLLTMREENEDIKSAIALGFIDAYVSKSASTNELLNALEKLLHQKRTP